MTNVSKVDFVSLCLFLRILTLFPPDQSESEIQRAAFRFRIRLRLGPTNRALSIGLRSHADPPEYCS